MIISKYIVHRYNYSNLDSIRRLCGGSVCDSNSLQSLISSASFFPKQTYIAQSSVNWLDDYMEWLNADPSSHHCCYEFADLVNMSKNDLWHSAFCDHKRLLDTESDRLDACMPCKIERGKYDLPSERTMMAYVDYFLQQNPSQHCIKAGHAMYGNAVKLIRNKHGDVIRIGRKCFH